MCIRDSPSNIGSLLILKCDLYNGRYLYIVMGNVCLNFDGNQGNNFGIRVNERGAYKMLVLKYLRCITLGVKKNQCFLTQTSTAKGLSLIHI